MTTTVVAATTIVRTRTIIVNAATRILPLLALITGSAYAVESTPAPATPGGHWISPLLMASQTLALAQPAVVRAEREVQRSALVEYQVLARWNPELTLGATHDENNRRSTNTYDGNGVIRDRNTAGTAAIGNTFSTGTTVKVQAGSTEYHTSNPSALDPLYYNSTVQLVVSQALLQGGSREVNRAELINAQVQAEADRDLRDDQLETLFASLGEDWLNLSQRQAEVRLRREHLELTRRNLQQSEERSRLGLGRELDVFSLRRDVAAQEAALATAERAETGIHERLAVSWPKLSLPASEHLSAVPPPVMPPTISFADTRAGHVALRRIEIAARTVSVARNNALDRLDLNATVGKNGIDDNFDRSWSEATNPETYHWSVGLTYVHRFGSDSERIELQRSVIALDQAKLLGDVDERAWRTQLLTLRLALQDAIAQVAEQERVLTAYREEFRLTKAQVDAGLLAMRDLITLDQQVNTAVLTLLQTRLDALRAELRLRTQEDRLLELAPK